MKELQTLYSRQDAEGCGYLFSAHPKIPLDGPLFLANAKTVHRGVSMIDLVDTAKVLCSLRCDQKYTS